MAFAPLIFMAASALMSAKGKQAEGEQAQQAADYNAAIANRNAGLAIQQGEMDAQQQRRKASITLGAARALYGASGVTMEGSPLDVLASSAANAELDNQTIKYRARLRALGYQEEAALDEFGGKNAAASGQSGAIGSLLGGASSLYSNYNMPTSGGDTTGNGLTGEMNGYGSST